MAIGDLVANLTMNTTGFSRGATSATSTLRGLSGTVSAGVGSIVSSLGPLGAAFAGAFALRGALDTARVQIQAEQKLAAVLKSTGNAAGLTAKEIGAYASSLQSATNFGDEVTLGAAAVLATFKEIKGDTFKQALASAQDLSTVMGQDLKSSVTQLGKALNDPIKGITALSRVGVSFTAQQKEQISVMTEAGDLAGAQALILKELQSEFGGAAAAIVDPWTQLKNSLGDLSEEIGRLLLPAIGGLSSGLRVVVETLQKTPGTIVAVIAAIGLYIGSLRAAATAQAIVLALQGPRGWAVLAASLGVAALAGYELQRSFDAVASSGNAATQAIAGVGSGVKDWRDEWSAASGEFDKIDGLLDRIAQLSFVRQAQPDLGNALAGPVLQGLQDIASVSTTSSQSQVEMLYDRLYRVKSLAAELGPTVTESLSSAIERQLGQISGIDKAIASAESHLAEMQGRGDELQLQKLQEAGATDSQLKKLYELQQAIKDLEHEKANQRGLSAETVTPSELARLNIPIERGALSIATKGSQEASKAINLALRGEKEKAAEQTADNTEEIAATASQQLGVLEDIRNNWRGGSTPVVVTFA